MGINEVVAQAQNIYEQNFFPEMNTDRTVHPANIGHKIWPGCFRCHDGSHTTADGKNIIPANCSLCQIILAQGNGKQLEKLNATGYDFFHIDSVAANPSCTMSHTGSL